MAKISELSETQFKDLLDNYFAPPEKRSQLTEKEIKELAEKLNEKINVPIISETQEEKILIKIVIKIDRFLYDNLPNEFYDLVRSIDNGIDDDEARRLIKRLSTLANKQIDIPYLPESVEYLAIRLIIGIIINSARKKWDFLKAKEKALDLNIPTQKNASKKELEGIIL